MTTLHEAYLRLKALEAEAAREALADEPVCDPDWLREARMPKTGIRNEDDAPD